MKERIFLPIAEKTLSRIKIFALILEKSCYTQNFFSPVWKELVYSLDFEAHKRFFFSKKVLDSEARKIPNFQKVLSLLEFFLDFA